MSPERTIVVVADDDDRARDVVCRLLTSSGYAVYPARDGRAAVELIEAVTPDLVVSDVLMPHVDGFDLCRRIKAHEHSRLTPVILITGLQHLDDRVKGIDAGADDILMKPLELPLLRARAQALLEKKHYTDDLDSAESVFLSLGLAVEARDHSTAGHCQRMAAYAAAFGTHLELPHEQVRALYRGGYLHDVGKIGVPDSILLKPGALTAAEHLEMQWHTLIGDVLCGHMRSLRPVRPIVRHHHERLDGSGYPDRLKGDAIPFLAQLMGIVDVYDALTTARQYRAALSADVAARALEEEARKGWRDPLLVAEFLSLQQGGGFDDVLATSTRFRSGRFR